jgi:hypothetical protein
MPSCGSSFGSDDALWQRDFERDTGGQRKVNGDTGWQRKVNGDTGWQRDVNGDTGWQRDVECDTVIQPSSEASGQTQSQGGSAQVGAERLHETRGLIDPSCSSCIRRALFARNSIRAFVHFRAFRAFTARIPGDA